MRRRIPHGTEVTEQRLKQVEDAEGVVRAQGFRQVRVRHLGTRARIEVGVDELPKLEDGGLRRRIATALQGCGFSMVEFDTRGYQSTGADSDRDTPLRKGMVAGRDNHEGARRRSSAR